MSVQNITIAEGGQGKNLSVNELETNKVGGGVVRWVPKADTKLIEKNISEDGEYFPQDDDPEAYGFSKVTVDFSRKIRTKRITENGRYYAEDEELRGYSDVEVAVPSDVHNTRLRATENGTYRADDEGYTGYYEVTVNVPAGKTRAKRITENGTYNPSNEELYGYGEITVDVPRGQLTTKSITENGTYIAADEAGNPYGYSRVNVNIPQGRLISKSITENGTYLISEDSDQTAYGYNRVVVNVPQQGTLGTKTIRANGTYKASDEELLGYSQVTVNVDGGALTTKAITENGTYIASNDNAYGYRSVSVHVKGGAGSANSSGKPTYTPPSGSIPASGIEVGGAGSAVVGTDPETGNDVVVGVDEDENLVKTPLPSSIVLVTNPTKMDYNDGESIDLSGAVVTAKMADGTTWTDADHPNGHVSCSPEPGTADASQSQGASSASSDLDTGSVEQPIIFGSRAQWRVDYGQGVISSYRYYEAKAACLFGGWSEVVPIVATDNPNDTYSYKNNTEEGTDTFGNSYTYAGKTVYYSHALHMYGNTIEAIDLEPLNDYGYDTVKAYFAQIAWTMIYGNITHSGQPITLNWARPGDGKVLSTTMQIAVTAASSESQDEGGGGGGHNF